MAGRHTLVLMQTERNKNSRTYLDYNSVEAAMDGLCRDFEKQLKRLNPNLPSITYDVQDLFLYIDNMPDMSALVYDQQVTAYIPCNKEWIKKKVCLTQLMLAIFGAFEFTDPTLILRFWDAFCLLLVYQHLKDAMTKRR